MAESGRGNKLISALVVALFFLSGACALVYELAWTRMFTVVAGGTTRALTAVLVAYMSGLALGGFLGGRYVDRRAERPVLVYGVLEGLIGALAVIISFAIPWALPLLKLGKSVLGPYPVWFDLYRFLVSALVLLGPTTLMGATFPILLRSVLTSRERFGFTSGYLYTANTLGAVAGSLLSGFVLIPALGLRATTLAAAAVNALILVLVAALPALKNARVQAKALSAAQVPDRETGPWLYWIVLAGYALSGLAAMVYQVGWARALSLSLGNTTYALSLIFAAYIGGLALGGAVITPLADRLRRPLEIAAGLEILIGFSALAVNPLFAWVTARMFNWALLFNHQFSAFQAVRFFSAFGLILVPTIAMGALFPLMVKLAGSMRPGVGEPAGQVYAANTLGAILGAFLAGHVLIRFLAVQNTLAVATGLSVLIGIVWLLSRRSRLSLRAGVSAAAAVCLATAVPLVPKWDPILMSSGPYMYANIFKDELASGSDIRDVLPNYFDVLFHEEDMETTVSVLKLRASGEIFLRINGKSDASSRSDMPTQELLAHIPLLLHPSPKRVMILGLASGVSAGSALRYPVERVDCLEISTAVIDASRLFEPVSNLNYDDPRFHLILDDARNYLALSDALYDVIILEPSTPWVSGQSTLFTREFYELIAKHLAPGGLAISFIPAYDLDARAMRLLLSGMVAAFPYATLWESIPLGDYSVIGSNSPIRADLNRIKERAAAAGVKEDLARVNVKSGEEIFARFVMGNDRIAAITAGAPADTDDRRQLEFSIPKLQTRPVNQRMNEIIQAVLAAHEPARAIVDGAAPADLDLLSQFDVARTLYYRAATRSNQEKVDYGEMEMIVQAWRNVIDYCQGRFPARFAAELLAQKLNSRAELRLGQGDREGALADWEEAFKLLDTESLAADKLTEYYLAQGDDQNARLWAHRALDRFPYDALALGALGNLALKEGKPAEAEQYLHKGIESMPHSPELQWKLALALASQNRLAEAEIWLKQMTARYPDLVEPKILLADILLDQGRAAEAAPYLRKARQMAPGHPLLKQLERKYPGS